MANTNRYDPRWISTFYDAYGEKEWLRWDKSPEERIKLHLHEHYLRQYLPRAQKVLEVGAGSGRFTKLLSQLGARIVVADISDGQLELNEANSETYGFKTSVTQWVKADVCDLSAFAVKI